MIEIKTTKIGWTRKISLWWKLSGQYMFSDLLQGLQNLWRWKRIVWLDRNWDHRYIFDILQFKLEQQAKYISKRDFHTEAKRDAERMQTCVRLIEKIKTEFYATEYMDYHETNYWFDDCEDQPGFSELKCETLSENYNMYIKKYSRVFQQLESGKLKNYWSMEHPQQIAMNIAQHNHIRAKRLLFTLLERNIESWWD